MAVGKLVRQREEAACAKLNLGLRVLRRRADGYHDIRTIFQTVDFSDRVEVRIWPDGPAEIAIACDRKDLENRSNLAWRAAELMARRFRCGGRISIRLWKSIPVGAGLGGGSSDAAAVLRALACLLPEPPSRDAVLAAAGELGSDVPFLVEGGTALGTGRGTDLQPLPDLPSPVAAIALPEVEVSTAWAYRALADRGLTELTQKPGKGMLEEFDSSLDSGAPSPADILSKRMVNDFESVVFQRFPSLADLKRRLLSLGARHALLSGSGAAVFGIFDSDDLAGAAVDDLQASGVRARAARFAPRTAYGAARGN